MKRTLLGLLIVGLIAGSLIAPAEAKKKKKPKPTPPAVQEPVQTPVNFFLRRVEGSACGDDGAYFLSIVDGDDPDGACGNAFYGVPSDLLIEAGLEENPVSSVPPTVYVASDGLPFVLDVSKEITGMIGVVSRRGSGVSGVSSPAPYGAGNTTLNIIISGTVGSESKEIGTAAVDYQVVPGGGPYEVEFTITPNTALNKVEFTGLEISLRNSGDSVMHGFYTTDDPASTFTIGTWK